MKFMVGIGGLYGVNIFRQPGWNPVLQYGPSRWLY